MASHFFKLTMFHYNSNRVLKNTVASNSIKDPRVNLTNVWKLFTKDFLLTIKLLREIKEDLNILMDVP